MRNKSSKRTTTPASPRKGEGTKNKSSKRVARRSGQIKVAGAKNKAAKRGASSSRPMRVEDWPRTSDMGRADLMVVFHGLLSFCYEDTEPHCEVAAYGKSHKHKLEISVVGHGIPPLPTDIVLSDDPQTLGVRGGTSSGPLFYMVDPFSRVATDDPNDFRWLLDLEGRDFYDLVIPNKKPNFYRPRFFIKTGTFYTLEKTFSTFERFNFATGEAESSLGNIAYCVAANIEIDAGQEAILTLNLASGGTEIRNFPSGDGPYKIFVNNICFSHNSICRSNDYFHHFASFDLPPGKPLYGLDLDEDKSSTGTHRCGVRFLKQSNDEAPCGSSGYGGTSGMPPP